MLFRHVKADLAHRYPQTKEETGAATKKLREQIGAFVPRAESVLRQAQRWVIEGAAVPAKEKSG